MAVINKENSYMEFPLQISRQYAGPIERYSVFYSLAEATTYATTSPIAYVGQFISVVDEANSTATAYQIANTKGDLVEIGSTSSAPMVFVDNEAAMLALTDIKAGQQVYRADRHTVWIFKGGDASSISNWVESAAQNDTVWSGTTNKVLFYAITQSDYDALNPADENTLYFVTDSHKIYKGSADMTQSVIVTSTIPDVNQAIMDKLYVDSSTFEAKITVDGSNWIVLTPGYLTDGANWASADSNKLATIGLIKAGIQEAVGGISLTTTFDSIAGTVKVGDGDAATLTGVAHNPTYDAATLTITMPRYGQDDLVINIPKDKFVTAGKFYENYPETNPTHHNVIVLTIDNQDDPVIIPAEAIRNIYEADNTDKNLIVTIDGNKVSAQLIIDPKSGNALTYSDAGFLVDISGKLDKLSNAVGQKLLISNTDGTVTESGYGIQASGDLTNSTTEIAANKVIYDALAKKYSVINGVKDNIVLFGDVGTLSDSGVAVGGATLAETTNDKTVATEAAVQAAISSALEWTAI